MPAVRKKNKSLQNGRPKSLVHKPNLTSASSATTARIIRTHHRLTKQHAAAVKQGDTVAAEQLAAQLEANGGLQAYQAASVTGQSAARGGDSSRQLMQWLEQYSTTRPSANFRLLEIGALAVDNACSHSGLFKVTRIDLNSRGHGIERQDFMQRPVPVAGSAGDCERFHIISLSLVLNYVPEAKARGQMLRRTARFLLASAQQASPDEGHSEGPMKLENTFPALFLVLPAACVTNSRYLDEARLQDMMASLGFVLLHRKLSTKLVYFLYQLRHHETPELNRAAFPKAEVNPGKTRNNFCIILDPSADDT